MRGSTGRSGHKALNTAVAVLFFNSVMVAYAVPASADEGRTIACFILAKKPADGQAATVMSSIIRNQMRKLVGITVRTGAPAGNPEAGVEAERLTRAGFTALNTGDKARAATGFQKAWDVLAQNPGVGDTKLHARVSKGLGVTSFLSGKTTRGKDLIKRSLLLYPKQASREYAYSVDVKNIFEHAKREIADAQPGRIEVKSTPDGAEVYLDGAFKGYTPSTLGNVPAGSHLVEVVKDGYLRWSTAADVAPGGRLPTEAVLTASPVQAELNSAIEGMAKGMSGKGNKFAGAVAKLKTAVRATEALVLYASSGSSGFVLRGYYQDLAGTVQPIKATVAQDADFYKSLRTLLGGTLQAAFAPDERAESLGAPPTETVDSVMRQSEQLGGETVIDPDSPLFTVQEKDKEESITGKWWFWTIIGAGALAIAGVVTAVVLTTGDDGSSGGPVGNLNIQLEQF